MTTDRERTGRLRRAVTPAARRLVLRKDRGEAYRELCLMTEVDRAHVAMLAEAGLIARDVAARLLTAVADARRERFAGLRTRSAPRGLYLEHERYLIEKAGAEAGGMLQLARSRNDLNATLVKLGARRTFDALWIALFRLQVVVIRRAHRYRAVMMPAFTHGQAAEPVTYGHYLAGVAEALDRDLASLFDAGQHLQVCPLGACAVAGTSLPIDPARTADLLGFDRPTLSSIDAVASRDAVLRLLASGAICGATLSRVATDLLSWTSSESQLLHLPDDLVGSSSAMPHKRNPFLLEHVQGRTATVLGAFTSAVAATRNTPFSNSIGAGPEAMRPVWAALADLGDSAVLLRLVVAGARPDATRMEQSAVRGFTSSTALAVWLTRHRGYDYRSAHHAVGALISDAMAKGAASLQEAVLGDPRFRDVPPSVLDPRLVAMRSEHGGGPGEQALSRCLSSLRERLAEHRRRCAALIARWKHAQRTLDAAVRSLCDGAAPCADRGA